MNNVNTQLDLLIEVLRKKAGYLQQLLTYTQEQSIVLEKDEIEGFNDLIQPKEELIDKVIEIDDYFQTIYENIRGIIEKHPELYKEKVQIMKQVITIIGDLGVAITVQEGRNKNYFDFKAKAEKKEHTDLRQSNKIVSNYYSNMNKQKKINQSPSFDSKK